MNETETPKRTVLIAEDDPVSRKVLEKFLEKWNYSVVCASNGSEAFEILERRDSPRLAVLDWMMPGMEGVQVCQRVREWTNRPYIYVVLLTARSDREDVIKGLDMGADDYLTKPFDSQELRARLHVGQRILELQDALISARDALQFQATHDSLTGVANRGVIFDALHREASRQAREHSGYGIILLDLDHFKWVNDTHGHMAGDAVLKETAQRISSCVRAYDIVGRYGGEEFLVVLPACDSICMRKLAERLRQAIGSQAIRTPSGEVTITASLGIAVSTAERPITPGALLHDADQALYRAKSLGRNRAEVAWPNEPASLEGAANVAPLPTASR
jgi:two-component system, cell cycle response regulator